MQSCRKTDSPSPSVSKPFTTKAAKEWWYGSFRKSAAYSQIDRNSPLAPPAGSSDKKYPSWKRAISYSIGKLQIVEMPLVYETNSILLPGMQKLYNTPEGFRIAKSVIHRLMLIKKADGTIAVRTVTIVPSPEYAKRHSYDISHISLKSLPSDFSGFQMISGWDKGEKNILRISAGKPVKKMKIIAAETLARQKSSAGIAARQVCEDVWIPNLVWTCVVVPTGDDIADQERCQEIGTWVEQGGYYTVQCHEEPDEDPCTGMSPEDCMCQLYGLGCGGGDNGGGDTDVLEDFDDKIIDSLERPCLSNVLNSLKNLQGGKIGEVIKKLSGSNPTWDWVVYDINSGPYPGVTYDNYPNGAETYLAFDKIQNYTDLAVARLMLHESVHAYLVNYFHNDPVALGKEYPELLKMFFDNTDTATAHHILMGDKLVNDVSIALKAYGVSKGYNIGDEVYHDLAWGGLYGNSTGVAAFERLTPFVRERIRNRNAAENSNTTRETGPPRGQKACN